MLVGSSTLYQLKMVRISSGPEPTDPLRWIFHWVFSEIAKLQAFKSHFKVTRRKNFFVTFEVTLRCILGSWCRTSGKAKHCTSVYHDHRCQTLHKKWSHENVDSSIRITFLENVLKSFHRSVHIFWNIFYLRFQFKTRRKNYFEIHMIILPRLKCMKVHCTSIWWTLRSWNNIEIFQMENEGFCLKSQQGRSFKHMTFLRPFQCSRLKNITPWTENCWVSY